MTNNDEMALKLKAAAEMARLSERRGGMEMAADSYEFIAMTTPYNILALLAERDADKERIAAMSHAFLNLKLISDVYLHAYEEAKASVAELESRKEKHLPEPYAYLRENDGQIQISIGAERPSDRSGGYATPWFAIYTAAGINLEVGELGR